MKIPSLHRVVDNSHIFVAAFLNPSIGDFGFAQRAVSRVNHAAFANSVCKVNGERSYTAAVFQNFFPPDIAQQVEYLVFYFSWKKYFFCEKCKSCKKIIDSHNRIGIIVHRDKKVYGEREE